MNRLFASVIVLFGILSAPLLRAADGALAFTPASQHHVNVPNFHSLGVSTEVTVEFWALTDATGGSAFILSPDDGANRLQAHPAWTDGTTYWDFGDSTGSGRLSVATPAGTVGTWTHWALVASQTGNFMKIYRDGAEIATRTGMDAFSVATSYALRIGGDTGLFFDGSLDEFRVWNVARTASQISANRGLTLTGSESGLRLYLKFDEAGGATALNSATATGAAFNGTLVNAPVRTTGPNAAYVVTTTADSGAGSLRQALADAAAAAGADTIVFAAGLSGGTITLGSEIVVNGTGGVTVDATALAGGLTVNGDGGNRLFSIGPAGSVALAGLNLTGGEGGGATLDRLGGAILNLGTLSLTRCTLHGNSTAGSGGAIGNSATLTLRQCTVGGNSAEVGGGGLYNRGSAHLIHCTVADNQGGEGGGGLYNDEGSLTLENSLVAGNSAPFGTDIYTVIPGTLTRVGANIVQTAVGGAGTVTGGGTLTVANPLLAALAANNGPTPTRATLPGSPARNAAVGSTITADQRGYALFGTADIGAYEGQLGTIAPVTVAEDTATGALPFSVGTVGTLGATSGNTALVPNANLTLGGSGGSRTITATPAAEASGTATLTVTDTTSGEATSFVLTVTAVNDPPTATRLNQAQTYTEDTSLNLGNIVITDVDSATVTATLTLSDLAAGTLTTATSGSVTSTFVAGTGVWTATGPVADVNTLLAGVSFNPALNYHANFSIASTVSDGTTTLTGSKAITGIPVTDTPSVTGTTTNEDTQTATGLVISRNAADGTEVTHFKVTAITSGTLFQNNGTAAITTDSFITSAQASAGLKFTPAADFHGAASFVVQASTSSADAGLGGSPVTATITVTPVADTPTVTSATTAEDTQSTTGLVISRNAADSTEVTHFKVIAITSGTLFQNDGTTAIAAGNFITFAQANAGLKFTPAANFHDSGSFTFRAATSAVDAGQGGSPVTATITVSAVNDPPTLTAIADPAAINEDAAQQTVNLSGISVGPLESGQTLTITATSDNTALIPHPTVTYTSAAATGSLGYTPVANAFGTATITVTVSDGALTAQDTFLVTVNPADDPPTLAALGNLALAPGAGQQTVNLTGIGTGAANETQTLTITATSANPTLIPAPAVTYTSPADTGSLSFALVAGQTGFALITVTVSDGALTTSRTFYVSVSVNSDTHVTHPGDSGPGSLRAAIAAALALPGSQSILFDSSLSGQTITLGSEIVIDDGTSTDTLTMDASSLPGGLTIDGGLGNNRIFSLASGDRAALRGLTLTGGNGTGASFSGHGGAINNDGTLTLTQCTLSGNSANDGGAIDNDGTLTLTQCTLSGNTASFGGAINNDGTLTLTHCLIAGNTASSGPDICFQGGTLTRRGVNLIGDNGTVTTQFPDGAPNPNGDYVSRDEPPLTPQLAALASNGGPTQTRGLLSGSLALNRIGNEAQSVTVSGSSGTFQLTFNGASTDFLSTSGATASQLQTALNALSTISSGGGSVTVVKVGSVFRVTFDGGPLSGVDQPLMTGSALKGTATVAVLAEGGLPFATDQRGFPIIGLADIGAYEFGGIGIAPIAPFSMVEDTPASFVATLVNPDALTLSGFTGSGVADNPTLLPPGSITVSGSGATRTVALTPAANQSGSATVTLTFTDGTLTAAASFLATVTAVAAPPTALALSATGVAENQPAGTVVGTLAGTDIDFGHAAALTFSLVSGPGDTDNLQFTVVGPELRTAAVFDFETQGAYSLRLRATDPTGLTYDQVVTVTVTDVNEAPVAVVDPLFRPDTTRVVRVLKSTLLANDTDADSDPLSLIAVGNPLPAGATVQLLGNFVIYVAPANDAGDGSFTYTLSDGPGGHEVTGTVTVTEQDPTANAGPNAAQIRAIGDDVVLAFIGVPGRRYRIQYATTLTPPIDWTEFSPGAIHTAGSNGVFNHTDVAPGDGSRFYRAIGE
jgi:hypothetical protein